MGDSFFQALKWFISVALIIGGIAALNKAESAGSLEPMILAVFSFGGAYIMSVSWRSLPGKAVVISLAFVILCGVFARYVPGIMRVYMGMRLDLNYYLIWIGLAFVFGLPLMMLVFNKFQNNR